MLVLDVGATEGYDEGKQEFVTVHGTLLELEHSLLSLSKWESYYEKPFLTSDTKITAEETVHYIQMMTLTPDVSPEIYKRITEKNIARVNEYITAKMTATWFSDPPGPSVQSQEKITSEVIYYWMVALNIPFHPCETWHLNRLLTLVKVCNAKNQPQKPKKKFTRSDLAARSALNAQRRSQAQTAG